MVTYLTETVYQRWYRQHQINLGYCIDLLNHLKERLDALPYSSEVAELENKMSEIDNNLEKIRARNFASEPLHGPEKFFENSKVLANILMKALGQSKRFKGIYQNEKERVMKSHQEYKFKENLKEIRERIEAAELKENEKKHDFEDEEKLAQQQG